jgi:hypothetical protein
MYCVYCGGDRFERRKVEHPIRDSNRIIGIVTIEVDFCLQCHEYYLDEDALKCIRTEKEKLRAKATAPKS